ncbi:ribosome recycling factor [Candidatus Margulisiibacteriota bacterium]
MTDLAKNSEDRMKKTIDNMKKSMAAVRTGRAAPSLLDHVVIEYYGTKVPLKQMASVSAPEPRLLVIQPYDKSAIQSIEKAIMTSDLGIQPASEGGVIRLSFPQLTEERRKDLVKLVKKEAEDYKVSIRSIRQDAMKEIKKELDDKKISEDQKKNKEDAIQKLTDKYTKDVEGLLAAKEKEVMEI